MSISVIIPTYNRAYIIKESIQSVLNQTISPIEIIIVDDYSTDNTEEIVKSFNNPKIIYTLNSRTKGANGARNTGINLAKGKYIAFQDSDDIWHSNKLEKQFNFMEKNDDYDMCFCSLKQVNLFDNIMPKRNIKTDDIKCEILKKNFISTQTIFIKTEIAKKLLFDEKLKKLQDWDFSIRLSEDYRIKHLNEVLVDVIIREDSITKRESPIEAYNQIFKKHPQLIDSCYRNKTIHYKILVNKSYKNKKWIQFTFYTIRFFGVKFIQKFFKKNELLY